MDKKSSRKYGGGWPFFGVVVTLGIVLALLGIGVGGGASIRVPFTESNLSAGGSLGKKEVVQQALPNYLRNKVADNNSFFNQSNTLTIWLAEGMGVIVLGKQPEAPAIDLNINLIR